MLPPSTGMGGMFGVYRPMWCRCLSGDFVYSTSTVKMPHSNSERRLGTVSRSISSRALLSFCFFLAYSRGAGVDVGRAEVGKTLEVQAL